ncbi:hypothetical protein HHL11_03565 [Ramlibacter sp. G-1-2-2]|uniref:Cupin domain-containing protein n=1 Tax=Ramlibacter agri TaxID=2728837 RepID=A0A848GVZ2_9BURK|nr:hypothetical protein [Ramlibacter agri]NML42816.1 hypothetical protein [Ramlibacter agri]
MPTVSSAEKALLGRYSPRGNANFRTQFMGEDRHKVARTGEASGPAPIAYLVEQAPHTELRAHFHVADQFQIFVTGSGRIGAHKAGVGFGHFVGPYSGYGPIVGGDEGVGYLTLRNAWDGGAQFLPEEVQQMRAKAGKRRELMFNAPPAQALPAGESTFASLLQEQADGLAAWTCSLGPDATVTGPDPAVGGGQFWIVMDGKLADGEQGLLQRLSLAFVAPDEPAYTPKAGPQGLQLLVLQFPRFVAAAAA